MVKDAQKKIFQDYLEEHMHVSLNFKWQDFMYFQYIGCRDELGAAAYIAGAKYAAKISDEDLQVLVEYPTAIKKRKFVFHGAPRAVQMLAKCYGGFISLELYWLLYNAPQYAGYPFGFAPKIYSVDNIEARVICEQVLHVLD